MGCKLLISDFIFPAEDHKKLLNLMFGITNVQKLAQKGCMEAIKSFFWPQNLATPKSLRENSGEAIF
jgi:hypothetical protein